MIQENPRTKRIADLIQRNLAIIIQREINDPRLAMVNISAVRVSRDLSYAKIYFTLIDTAQHGVEDVSTALKKAGGFMRVLLAKRVELRIMPQLKFCHDVSISHARKMSKLIDEAIARDQQIQ